MKIRNSLLCCALVAVFTVVLAAQTNSCESLSSLALPTATITMAQAVPAGEMQLGGRGGRGGVGLSLPAYCRVAATLKPSNDSEILMEIWLPSSNWNGSLEVNGNGGWTGSINPASLADGLKRGYAAATSDLGHEGGSASFALGHPEKLIDFAYRAAHETTVASKAIVGKFYGRAAKLSYWNGCSAGGRSALVEAQRYPNDFDGIVAGSPGLNWTGRATQAVWVAQATHKSQASFIPASKFALIHNAAVQACDARDGAKDGIIEDPTRCNFDPKELECKEGDSPTCLTSAQVETARAIYTAYPNQSDKRNIFPGFERGSELGWSTMGSANPFVLGTDLFKFIVYQDPNWDFKTFNFATDVPRTEKAGADMNAMNPDLKAFLSHGGKMIQYHGWADPQITPGSSVNYYKNVLETMGGTAKVQSFYRLYMVPGMAHCGGGEGTSNFDMLSALEQWVEKGKAPDSIPASRVANGQVDRTRPLCPYPQVAQYKGSGSIDDAANFSCKLP